MTQLAHTLSHGVTYHKLHPLTDFLHTRHRSELFTPTCLEHLQHPIVKDVSA